MNKVKEEMLQDVKEKCAILGLTISGENDADLPAVQPDNVGFAAAMGNILLISAMACVALQTRFVRRRRVKARQRLTSTRPGVAAAQTTWLGGLASWSSRS
jgi:hypothetical protein